jgi:hypothetical protein
MKYLVALPLMALIAGIFSAKNVSAQNSEKYQPDKPGSTKTESNLWQFDGNKKSVYENNLAKVTSGFTKNNSVLSAPKGFDLHIWYFGMYDENYKLRACNYGVRSDIRFDFELFILENGKEVKWIVEPPDYKLYINNTASGHGSNFCNYEGYKVQDDDPSLEIPFGKAVAGLCDLFEVFPLEEELAPGVRLYGDGNLIVFNPDRPPFWVPVTVKEVMDLKMTYFNIREADKQFVYPYLKEAYEKMTPDELNAPAYNGGDAVFDVTAEKDGLQIMRFNKDYWDRTLPETAIQFVVLHYKFTDDAEMQESVQNNGHANYPALTVNAINLHGLAGLIEKK